MSFPLRPYQEDDIPVLTERADASVKSANWARPSQEGMTDSEHVDGAKAHVDAGRQAIIEARRCLEDGQAEDSKEYLREAVSCANEAYAHLCAVDGAHAAGRRQRRREDEHGDHEWIWHKLRRIDDAAWRIGTRILSNEDNERRQTGDRRPLPGEQTC